MKSKIKFYKKNFIKNFKKECFICGVKIPKNWVYYQAYGNSCKGCSASAQRSLKSSNASRPLILNIS